MEDRIMVKSGAILSDAGSRGGSFDSRMTPFSYTRAMLKRRTTIALIILFVLSSTLIGAGTAEDAFRNHRSGVMVTAEGIVIRLLADDNDGSRHQRFILRLPSGQTLLIAHNIDLSTRVPVQQNVLVKLHGQYEWSDKGGTVHWTHRDPQQKHEGGWLEVNGRRYN
jgi:hypothetical protein